MKKFNKLIILIMNIHMKPFILLLFLSCCLFSCSEDEIKSYHGDQYLYFSQLKGTEDKSVNVSFNNYPLDDELTVKIAMGLSVILFRVRLRIRSEFLRIRQQL